MLPLLALAACTRYTPATPDDPPLPGDDTGDSAPTSPGPAPAVVLFVGDGMGFEHVAGGSLHVTGERGGLTMETAPHQGRVRTASLSGVTDSAAAATALASGHKTWNDVVGLDADGLAVESIVERARAGGLATGVVTTDAVTGATPASFLVHVATRYDTTGIATGIAGALPDVLLGGGRGAVEPLLDPSVELVTTADELAAASGDGPLVGLFADTIFPYLLDGYGEEPTLAEMTDAALDRLAGDPDGFVLVVESARIDHASHSNLDGVHLETAALDEAVARVLAREWGDRDLTVLVTADHECGGLTVGDAGEPSWRLGDHTNADVPVFGWGDRAAALAGERVDNLWIHAVLAAAIDGTDVVAPDVPRLADGELSDLGEPVVAQVHASSFGAGHHQLDALRVAADADGLWVGVDGVFDDHADAVIAWIDLDWGAGTGVGADLVLADADGRADTMLSTFVPSPALDGLGFDAALIDVSTTDVRADELYDEAGLRLFHPPHGSEGDLWWMAAVVTFDDGNVAYGDADAPDAGPTGETAGGMEAWVPWASLAPDGLPAEGTTIAVFVVMTDTTGDLVSNQALPPFADAAAPARDAIPVASVVLLEVDAAGLAVGAPALAP